MILSNPPIHEINKKFGKIQDILISKRNIEVVLCLVQINIHTYILWIIICSKQRTTSLFIFVNNNSATLSKIKTIQLYFNLVMLYFSLAHGYSLLRIFRILVVSSSRMPLWMNRGIHNKCTDR